MNFHVVIVLQQGFYIVEYMWNSDRRTDTCTKDLPIKQILDWLEYNRK